MSSLPLRYARRKFSDLGFTPRTRLARAALITAGIELTLYLTQQVFMLAGWKGAAGALEGWIAFLTFVNAIVFTSLALRWTRRVLLWRLRNRLFVTYVFIGVIPVLLIVAMAGLTGYLLAGQFAAYVAHTDVDQQIRKLESMNDAVAASQSPATKPDGLAQPSKQATALAQLYAQFPQAELRVWRNGQLVLSHSSNGKPGTLSLPTWVKDKYAGLALDGEQLYLRAASTSNTSGAQIMVASSVPVDEALLQKVGNGLGEIIIYKGHGTIRTKGRTIQLGGPQGLGGPPDPNQDQNLMVKRIEPRPGEWVRGGAVPPSQAALDARVSWGTLLMAENWSNGEQRALFMQAVTRLSALYATLFSTFSELAEMIRTVLILLAVVFGVIEIFALMIGIGLTRTITRSVAALYRGTEYVNRGDLRHRIVVRSRDQLAALETSFNSMTESLARLIEEQKEKQRLESELAIAQEVQAQLFPRSDFQLPSLELHGVCKPARTVSGDYYDFVPIGAERLGLAVGDISGKGISAALLMATIHSAVRVYEFGGIPDKNVLVAAGAAAISGARNPEGIGASVPYVSNNGIHSPSEVLWLLNRHLFHSTPAEKYATLFLGVYDGRGHELTYTNAGHLPPLIITADGELKKLDTGGTVIGLFEEISYEESRVKLATGDLFVAYSDGVTEPENEYGEFGEHRLIELLRETRRQPLERISEAVIGAVKDWMAGAEQPDDLTLVLARTR